MHVQEKTENQTLAECFADFFYNTFSNGVQPYNKKQSLQDSYKGPIEPSELDYPISVSEIKVALSSVKGGSCGLDMIHYNMLKRLPVEFLSKLAELFNYFLDNGVYPDEWKVSIIVPILKPGRPACRVDSYRPISLLSVLGKLFEKVMCKRIIFFTKKYNVLTNKIFSSRGG